MTSLFEDLKWRGLIYQCSDEEGLEKALNEGSIRLYNGVDPTAESIHIGNLVGILVLRRFQLAGHSPMPLVGGATGQIGDPKPTAERVLNSKETVAGWVEKIKRQLSQFLDFENSENKAIMVNNLDWTSEMDVITFLRDIGKHFNINYMLAKETVQSRLETGISYTEFSYMILQSMDYLELHRKYNCRLQIGGSDQWGNITAGHELIRKVMPESKVFALTYPLVTKADGTKFGKSESGTIWLDREKTSPYEFYQFWVNTADADVVKYFKFFSFKSREEIESLATLLETEPEKRAAQKALAEELTELVHGKEALEQALRISDALFSGDIKSLTVEEIRQGFKDVPTFEMAKGDELGLVEILVNAQICPSKRQAREDIANGAVSINGVKQTDVNYSLIETDMFGGEFTIIRRGKKKYTMIKFI
ncbi:MAG: tyrS [Bacillales bacterium]|jgi:tyrosyl-tRNA synthetase|nr:tyrS [Bacillales bacterium]